MADATPTAQQQIAGLLAATKDSILLGVDEKLQGVVLDNETTKQKLDQMATKKDVEPVIKLGRDFEEFRNNYAEDRKALDILIAERGKPNSGKKEFETEWKDAISKEIGSKENEIKEFQKDRKGKIVFNLDGIKAMTISGSVTGDAVQGYSNRQGLVPAQNINFRDILDTTPSPTGSFVTYRETNTVQTPGLQTEGSSKTDLNYAFTEIKQVSNYISGKVTFSKQLMYSLPFLETTLPRMLIRDFYKKENDYFFIKMAQQATGNNNIVGAATTVDAEEMLQMIANQRTANFDASYLLVDWRQWARILSTKPADYSVPGGVVIDSNGITRFAGIPMIAASWAQSDKVLLYDRSMVERVETESLRVEFSFENEDNFIKNNVTARVECFEELNILRPDGIIYRDFGNS